MSLCWWWCHVRVRMSLWYAGTDVRRGDATAALVWMSWGVYIFLVLVWDVVTTALVLMWGVVTLLGVDVRRDDNAALVLMSRSGAGVSRCWCWGGKVFWYWCWCKRGWGHLVLVLMSDGVRSRGTGVDASGGEVTWYWCWCQRWRGPLVLVLLSESGEVT